MSPDTPSVPSQIGAQAATAGAFVICTYERVLARACAWLVCMCFCPAKWVKHL